MVSLSMEGLGDKEVAQAMGLAIGTVRTYWKRIAHKTGGNTRAEIVATVARSYREGEVVELRAEIDAQREAEERFRAICECAPLGIFMADHTGALTFVNGACARHFGLARELATGFGYLDCFSREDRAKILRRWEVRAAGETAPALEFRVLHPDGAVRWLRSNVSPLVVRDVHLGYVGTIEDVTDRYSAKA